MASELAAFAEIARWYLVTAVIGSAGLLPAALLFGRLDSRGVLFGRPFGLLIVGYVAWLIGWGVPSGYGDGAVALGLGALATWSAALAWRRPALVQLVRGQWRLILLGEALFLIVFGVALFGRSLAPDAFFTEKPMDMMILVAIHDADELPPPDSWFAGRRLSYYHLGHTMVDAVSRLAGVNPAIAFNIGLASAGAMAGAAAFGLANDVSALGTSSRRRRTWLAAGVATGALLLLASLEGGLELLAANGLGHGVWARIGIEGFPGDGGASRGIPTGFWWWWRATRVLPDAISEFPAFSLILGDLHAHVLALPLSILGVAIAVTAFEGSRPQTMRVWRQRPGELACVALIFAGLAMTNAWDAPLYGLVWLAAGFASYVATGWGTFGALYGMARHMAPPTALAGLLAWPMLAGLESAPVGFSPVLTSGSDPVRLFLFWGPLAAMILASALVIRPAVHRGVVLITLLYAGTGVLGWVLAAAGSGNAEALSKRGWGWLTLPLLALAAAFALGGAARAYEEVRRARAAWLALAAFATLVVLGTELFHLVDTSLGRFNTVFKFWYGAWLLLATAAGVAVADAVATLDAREARGVKGLPAGTRAVLAGTALLVGLCLLYAPAALVSRGTEGSAPGLDALAYLDGESPADGAAIRWARAELPRTTVLLEAVGKSFDARTSRVSMITGLPTVIGWPGHQLTWRGDDAGVNRRIEDVAAFYASGASERALEVARRYGVTHVYLGPREREAYGADVAARFAGWHTVFEADGVRVVEVPVEASTGVARP